jgi:DNA-nicking Smr family endonuclease
VTSKGEKKRRDAASPFAALKGMKAKLEEEAAAKKAPAKRASAGKAASSPRPTTAAQHEDEALSFHRMMSGVTPLDRKAARIPKSAHELPTTPALERAARNREDAKSAAEREAEEVHAHLRALVEGNTRFEVEDDGRHVEGRRVDLPADMLRRLRRGTVPIDARLDLHGLHAGEAREALEKFLREKRVQGEKCVLVVHGKGEHSPRGQGVLRGEIAAWLSQSSASEHVAAFATAVGEDGGGGAVYVLLRR